MTDADKQVLTVTVFALAAVALALWFAFLDMD